MPIWEFPFKFDKICRPDWIKPGTRVINELDLGAALTGEMKLDPPVMSLFVYNSNPVSQAPAQSKIISGLRREDLFTVVSELFITDTARYADVLLPATMQAEQYDLMVTWGHLYMMLNQPAIPARGECVPNVELFRRLAKTMGFDDPYWDMTEDEMLQEFYDWNSPQLKGITLDLLKEHGFMRLNVGDPDKRAPHAKGNFKTPSGKSEFKAHAAENGNFVVPVWRSMYEAMQPAEPVDPVPDYIPPYETPRSNPELAKRYPLNIVSPKPHAFLNTQYANEPVQQRRQGEQTLLIHPFDAAARNIENGSYVRVFNDRGSVEARAEVSDDVMPGLVLTSVGYWPSLNRGGTSINAISADKHCGLGKAGTYSDNLVEVARL
jgi:anaerobic selenocysteine-containing dehydrogenase